MEFDLKKLQSAVKQEIEESKKRGSREGSGQYSVVYPGENGKLTLRLLFNPKFYGVQRKIIRHNKLACLQIYGEDCPVCQAISNVEASKGKEAGAFPKYGYKTRGICFAQVIDHDATYFKGENDPKKGDIIIFMYPKTIYDQINAIVADSGDNLDKILCYNEGIPIVIERSQKNGGFPDYKAIAFPYGTVKSFEDSDGLTGQQKFDALLESLPDLGETIVPKYPDEETRNGIRALSETVTQEYLSNMIVNPGDAVIPNAPQTPVQNAATMAGVPPVAPVPVPDPMPNYAPQVPQAPVVQQPVVPQASATAPAQQVPQASVTAPVQQTMTTAGRPACFGNHNDQESKCLICEYETECYMKVPEQK